ncbi:MAG: hypothetical protein ACLGIA_11115 [Actinomycetes bacterium]
MFRARRLILLILVAFAIYAILRSPDQAASIVRSAIDGIREALSAIGRFFDALLKG